jgi:hypothetical protein
MPKLLRRNPNQTRSRQAMDGLYALLESEVRSYSRTGHVIRPDELFRAFRLSQLDYKGQLTSGHGLSGLRGRLSGGFNAGGMLVPEILNLAIQAGIEFEHAGQKTLVLQRQSPRGRRPISFAVLEGYSIEGQLDVSGEASVGIPDYVAALGTTTADGEEIANTISAKVGVEAEIKGKLRHVVLTDSKPRWFRSIFSRELREQFRQQLGPGDKQRLKRETYKWLKSNWSYGNWPGADDQGVFGLEAIQRKTFRFWEQTYASQALLDHLGRLAARLTYTQSHPRERHPRLRDRDLLLRKLIAGIGRFTERIEQIKQLEEGTQHEAPADGADRSWGRTELVLNGWQTGAGAGAAAEFALTSQLQGKLGHSLAGSVKATSYRLQTLAEDGMVITQATNVYYCQFTLETEIAAQVLLDEESDSAKWKPDRFNSLSYQSAVAFWRPVAEQPEQSTSADCLAGSGFGWGVSVRVARLQSALQNPADKRSASLFDMLTRKLRVKREHLQEFLARCKDTLGRAARRSKVVLLESSFAVPQAKSRVALKEGRINKKVDAFADWFKMTDDQNPQALRLRVRLEDFKDARRTKFKLGVPDGLTLGARAGIELIDAREAGRLAVVDLHTHFFLKPEDMVPPTTSDEGFWKGVEEIEVPPVALLCQ